MGHASPRRAAPAVGVTTAPRPGHARRPGRSPRSTSRPRRRRPTGVAELDRVLGGGLVPGAVVLLAGEPGVGKSTLLLDVAAAGRRSGPRVLYVTGEESAAQVRLRAERIGALRADGSPRRRDRPGRRARPRRRRSSPTCWSSTRCRPSPAPRSTASPGGVSQVREVAAALIRVAKERGIATVLVGHVTKDGSIAGPRVLEHLVDVVLHFEGDRHSPLRHGPRRSRTATARPTRSAASSWPRTASSGWPTRAGCSCPGTPTPVPGTCVTVTLEGRRPLVAEVQALVAPSPLANPAAHHQRARLQPGRDGARRAASGAAGCTAARRATSTPRPSAACGSPSRPPTSPSRSPSPSAAHDRAAAAGLVAIGEVGLAGEIRPVARRRPPAGRGRPARVHPRARAAGPPASARPAWPARGRRPRGTRCGRLTGAAVIRRSRRAERR